MLPSWPWKCYISATPEINAKAIAALNYTPGVARAKKDLLSASIDMKAFGYLKPETNPEELVNKAWHDLPGVTDEWVKGLTVQTMAGQPSIISDRQFAQYFDDPRNGPLFRFCPDDCSW